MTDLAELKRLAEAARSANKQSGYDALARACTASAILSLIERVAEAEAHVTRLQHAVGGASIAAYQRGMEDAAKFIDVLADPESDHPENWPIDEAYNHAGRTATVAERLELRDKAIAQVIREKAKAGKQEA